MFFSYFRHVLHFISFWWIYFVALYLVYSACTCAVIISFLVSDFRVPLLLLLLLFFLIFFLLHVITFMQGTYNYVPGKTNVSRLYNFAAFVYQQFVQHAIIYCCYDYYYYYNHHRHSFQFLKACALMEWSKSSWYYYINYLNFCFHFVTVRRHFNNFWNKTCLLYSLLLLLSSLSSLQILSLLLTLYLPLPNHFLSIARFLFASTKTVVAANGQKTKCILKSREEDRNQNRCVRVTNMFF